MSKYDKYFLPHILYIQDHFCKFYVQRPDWCPHEILDVACIILDHSEDAQELIRQCLEYEQYTTMRGLRVFLSDDCSECYQVHRMDDLQVIQAVALQLTMRAFKIVIEPKDDWAVEIDAYSGQPHLPISVQAAPDPETIFEEIKQELDGLVAEQQQKYDQYEAMLAKMTQAQKSALYSKKAGSGLYEGTIGGIVDLAKAIPGFYVGYLKTLWRIRNLPRDASRMLLDALISGDTSPIEDQIDQIIKPVAQTFDQADRLKSMLMVLFGDERTMAMLGDFAQRYWDATHPLERTEIGATAASDIVLTILLAIMTVGVGAAANVAAKAPRLAKLAKLLEKLTGILKSTGPRHYLPTKEVPGSAPATTRGGSSKPSSRNARQGGGMPEVQTPQNKPAPGASDRPMDSMDKTKEKDIRENDKIDGPKKTQKKLRKPPASLNEAIERLGEARERLFSNGFKPKYSDSQLKAMAAKGEVNDRFVVRFMESKYAKGDGYLGPMNDGKVRYWSTTFDQIENADTDPKRISESLGLDYDPSKDYKLAVIDTADAAKYGDSHTIIPTHEKLGEFAASELKDIPQDKIPKVLNDGYSDEFARAMGIAKKDGVDIRDMDDLSEFSDTYFSNKDGRELFKIRAKIQNELGANEYFTGNGLTAYTGKEGGNVYGTLETFTFDKNPQTIDNMMSDGRMKLLDTSQLK
jgi:hypothetical protein